MNAGPRVRRSRRSRTPLGWILWRRRAGAPSGCVLTSCVAAITLGLVLWSSFTASVAEPSLTARVVGITDGR